MLSIHLGKNRSSDQFVNPHIILLYCRICRDMLKRNSSGENKRDRRKVHLAASFLSAARTCQEGAEREREKKEGKTKQETHHTANRSVCIPCWKFPSRKSPYPPTSILVPADRNEISICIREPRSRGGLWTPDKVNNDLKFSRRHLRRRRRLRIAERAAFLR